MNIASSIQALAVGVLLVGAHALACPTIPTRLILDFDDTTKITDVMNTEDEVANTLLSHSLFAGIPELYRGFAADNCANLDFVSGGLDTFSGFTESDLESNNIPFEFVHERPNLVISIYDFKMDQFTIAHTSYRGNAVAMGDDTQSDYQVMNDIKARYPGWLSAGYIHVVRGDVKLPQTVNPYYTTFEVALMEYAAGRASEQTVMNVANAVLKSNLSDLFPDYTACPASVAQFSAAYRAATVAIGPRWSALVNQMNTFITKSCAAQNEVITIKQEYESLLDL